MNTKVLLFLLALALAGAALACAPTPTPPGLTCAQVKHITYALYDSDYAHETHLSPSSLRELWRFTCSACGPNDSTCRLVPRQEVTPAP